jgi:pyruvate dehydrogenase E2 component (dihydrolipoamide acetyltransferase)
MAAFTMPALGADMESGKVVEWHVRVGDRVHPGDVVAVVETHKGAIDVECFLDGVVESLVPLGKELPVGAPMAQVRVAAEPAGPAAASGSAPPVATTRPAAPAAPAAPRQPTPSTPAAAGARARVTPAARRHAAELKIDVDTLKGTASDGAVTWADVEQAAAQRLEQRAPQRLAKGGFDPAAMREAIAAAMSRSKREIPHYYLQSTIDFAAAQAWLEAYNADRAPAERLLPATLLLKATAQALLQVPQLNGFYEHGAFRAGAGVHIGWAISLRGGGLVAPAIHHADRLALPELMRALRDLVQRARTGGLRSSELTDPTITVTNLGERGAESVLGVIYPPQVAIVGFGRASERPWVSGGQVVTRPLITSTLAADHRASDGHLGGQLLALIERALQSPQTL